MLAPSPAVPGLVHIITDHYFLTIFLFVFFFFLTQSFHWQFKVVESLSNIVEATWGPVVTCCNPTMKLLDVAQQLLLQ